MACVLVVDDEEDLVTHLSNLLQRNGWETVAAYDGVEAVLKVMGGGVDGVLMDIRMPNLDGLGALKLMRRHSPKLPVIMFTGQAGQGDMMTAHRLGAYACLLKPVDLEQVIKALREAMDQSRL
jgi:two-component system, NtrC family, response regulator AtoC